MNKIEHPLFDNFSKTSNNLEISCGVKTDVGSSIINNSGFCSKHLMISTLCCSPTERLKTLDLGSICNPYSLEIVLILFSKSSDWFFSGSARDMFSNTVNASNNEKCWKTIPIPNSLACFGPLISIISFFQITLPLSGFNKP